MNGDEIMAKLKQLQTSCTSARLTIQQHVQDGESLDFVHVSGWPVGDAPSKRRAVFVFGEHARELVSSESALHFARRLCDGSTGEVKTVLLSWDFTLVPIANRKGRALVEEKGDYCKRTNENGVDLNRNWGDEHRDDRVFDKVARSGSDDDDKGGDEYLQQNPGPNGFSEPETRMMRMLVQEVKPEVFLSIHSGAYLLSMPFGYSVNAPAPPHAENMKLVLKTISDRFCSGQCPYGRLALEIGYNSTGCDIDYVAERLKVPYAFTWEIYASAENRGQFIRKALEERASRGGDAEARQLTPHTGAAQSRQQVFLAVSPPNDAGGDELEGGQAVAAGTGAPLEDGQSLPAQEIRDLADESCFQQFNPQDEQTLTSLLDNWSEAYLALCAAVEAAERVSSSSSVARLSALIGSDSDTASNATVAAS